MVQKKTTQKSKTNPVPKKLVKSATLSNGFGDDKSHEPQSNKAIGMKKKTVLNEVVLKTVKENPKTMEVESNPVDSEQSKPGTSKEASEIGDAIKQSSLEPEIEEPNTEAVSKSKSRKRVANKIVNPNDKKEVLVKSRGKAKRQKVVLDVPTLKSIPGKLFVVGDNDVGQLGLDEDVDSKEKPFLLDLPYSIIDVAAGGMHSVCLTENGEVITFGCNDEGALGRVTTGDIEERTPHKVSITEKIVQISAGDSHSAALAESGQVYLWGNFRNSNGQMGLTAAGQNSVTPVKVLNSKKIVKIASGGDHLACLSDDGVVYTCGCCEQGQLGRITQKSCQTGGRKGLTALLTPGPVECLKPKAQIDDVWTESYATFLKANESGSIYAFGLNNYGQLGIPNTSTETEQQTKYFPQALSSFNMKSWQQMNGGQHHTIALDNDGLVHSLGRKDYGRLGLGSDCEDKAAPTVIPTFQETKCVIVSCGNCVSYAVTEQGSLYSWGMSSSQLGHGNRNDEDIHEPRQIGGELLNSWEVYKVAGGGQHALILACPKKGSNKTTKA